jgi:outer membrane scaffolding protein for murein synthesis (MipA/OmpV family)
MLFQLLFTLLISLTHGQFQTMRGDEGPPLYELGGGAVWSQIPDYPGARFSKKLFIPFPAGLYRGERLRADEDGGMRSRFFYNDFYEVNLSIGGSLPAKSKDNPDREGMPGLDTVLELGPGLILHFYKLTPKNRFKLSLNLPFRSAFSFDSDSLVGRGFIFNPMLYGIYDRVFIKNLSLFTSFDFRYATKKNQDFYYGVGPLQARDFRPVYTAKGGYMGLGYGLGFNYNYKNRITVFTGGYYSNYHGSANEDAFLLRKKDTLSIAVGLVWWFYHSPQKGVAL